VNTERYRIQITAREDYARARARAAADTLTATRPRDEHRLGAPIEPTIETYEGNAQGAQRSPPAPDELTPLLEGESQRRESSSPATATTSPRALTVIASASSSVNALSIAPSPGY